MRTRIVIVTIYLFLQSAFTGFGQWIDIRAYGAVGDGTTDNTIAIQRAIDSAAANGGTVFFPAGQFLSATLYLRSNVTLHLSGDAVLLGHPDPKQYPYQPSPLHFYGEEWAKQALIVCHGQHNVRIEGTGTIDGQGAKFVVNTIKKPDRYRNRPYLLWFVDCKDVQVKGVHLQNSAFWMQHYLGCDGVLIDGITVWNHSNKNNDMMDIDGCRNVTVSNVRGDSDDDGITVKSTSPLISENITISNCIVSSHCNAIKFGTESTGGFRNVVVSNCVIRPSAQRSTIYGKADGMGGLSLELVDGGIMENISINNVVIEGAGVPIFIRLGNRARKYMTTATTPTPGTLQHVRISNVIATGADVTGCSITGIPGARVQDVSLDHISIETAGTDSLFNRDMVVEEKEAEYPEGVMFGKLPAYGLYVRHADGIHLSDISIRSRNADHRVPVLLDDVTDFSLQSLRAVVTRQTPALVYTRNSRNGTISFFPSSQPVRGLLTDRKSIHIIAKDLSK